MVEKRPYPVRRKKKEDFKVCTNCKENKPPIDFVKKGGGINLHSWCKICLRNKISDMRTERRLTVISHYSNGTLTCLLCAFDTINALDIDHIDGIVGKREDSRDLIKRLIEENFPKGYRILCRNCNWLEWIRKK